MMLGAKPTHLPFSQWGQEKNWYQSSRQVHRNENIMQEKYWDFGHINTDWGYVANTIVSGDIKNIHYIHEAK